MKITFYGAAGTVTGSCYLVEAAGVSFLVDCGMFQGGSSLREMNNPPFEFSIPQIRFVILTHAHIDHSGRLPKLVKEGYSGPIYMTEPTAMLAEVMLLDSAHIQETEAAYDSRKAARKGEQPVEPLYNQEDAQNAAKLFSHIPYNKPYQAAEGVVITMRDAGHMLGSSILEIDVKENGKKEKIVFSGDLGNAGQPLMSEPYQVTSADYVLCETTYGGREHTKFKGYSQEFLDLIMDTMKRKGTMVIPAFAVGRTQEILYELNYFKENAMLGDYQRVRVILDSPLAIEATEIFKKSIQYLDEETRGLAQMGDDPFVFSDLEYSLTADTSKAINDDPNPKIIISASGMADAGRVRHHIKHSIYDARNTILFVGYQAEGTLGNYLLSGATDVKLFGETIAVHAKIASIDAFSAHADHNGIMQWLSGIQSRKATVLIHGEPQSLEAVADALAKTGERSIIAKMFETLDLENLEFGNAALTGAIGPDNYTNKLADMAQAIAERLRKADPIYEESILEKVKLFLESVNDYLDL